MQQCLVLETSMLIDEFDVQKTVDLDWVERDFR